MQVSVPAVIGLEFQYLHRNEDHFRRLECWDQAFK